MAPQAGFARFKETKDTKIPTIKTLIYTHCPMPTADNNSGKLQVPDGFRVMDEKIRSTRHVHRCGPFYARRDKDTGMLTVGCHISERDINAAGHAHGGFLLTMADFSAASAAMRSSNDLVATVSLSSEFLAPAPMGYWLFTDMQILRETKRLVFISGALKIRQRPVMHFSCVMSRRQIEPSD